MTPFPHPWVDAAVGAFEDAAVLRPPQGPPLVLTVDFITPVVDDAETFGAIAAANALSDVYAMGGEPHAALAICGYPSERIGLDVLEAIFRGGRNKAAEAGCAIVGGHTVKDAELKYGLCVIGSCMPDRVLTQIGARPGDRLVLSKPLGMGIVSQAIKNGQAPAEVAAAAVAIMTTLNRAAKTAGLSAGVRAATDVTGFGFLGHLRNLLVASGVSAEIDLPAVPVLGGVRELTSAGHVPGGTRANLAWVSGAGCAFAARVSDVDRLILADAQTSGGLLMACPADQAARLVEELRAGDGPGAAVVGTICEGADAQLRVRC